MTKIGDRVGAILDRNEKQTRLLGYGVYQGQEVPPREVAGEWSNLQIPNPKILLDNGDVVWGLECWWGSEEEIKELIKGLKIIDVRIGDFR